MLSATVRCCLLRKNVIVSYQRRNKSFIYKPRIIRSKLPDVTIPNVFVEDIIFEKLPKWENKIALECATTGRSYSYLELYKKSRVLANKLHSFPTLTQQDVIAIILPNVPEYPIIMLGAAQAGLRVTTVNPLYTADEIAKQLKDSGAKLIFTLNELWTKLIQAMQTIQNQTFSTVVINHTQNRTPVGAINFKDLTDGDHNLTFKITRSQDDVLVLPYSSGTTGLPKGVAITNKNVNSVLTLIQAPEISYNFDENDVIPGVLPMFHIYGMIVIMFGTLIRGSKLITMSKFEPQFFIDVFDKHKPTVTFLVPPLVLFMINHPGIKQKHLNHLKVVLSGAAPLGATDIERLQEKSKRDLSVLQGYGLTETTAAVCFQTGKDPNGVKPGGSGFCARNTEVKIVSIEDNDKILGANESGELFVRAPQIMRGYYNNLRESEKVLNSDGWLRTGDIGYYDEDDHIFVTDRLKELIKVSGFQVAPAELEEILRDIPDVVDAAVAGVPHELFGEVPKAFIVLGKGSTLTPERIQEYMKTKVAKHKQLLGGVVTVGGIPKTASGKILRRKLREL